MVNHLFGLTFTIFQLMSMIHACIEESQGLKDLYNQGFEKKKHTCSMGSKAKPNIR